MSRPEQHSDIESRLSDLGEQLGAIRPIAGEVSRRINSTTMEPSRAGRWMVASIVAVVAMVGAAWWVCRLPPQVSPRQVAVKTEKPTPSLEIDGVSIRVRFAGMIDSRSTLVCWSCSGASPVGRSSADKDANRPIRRGGYTEIPVRIDVSPTGEVFCWSLFIADAADPVPGDLPTVCVQAANSQVGFGVWPENYSRETLPGAIASADRAGGMPVKLPEIREVIQNYIRNVPLSN